MKKIQSILLVFVFLFSVNTITRARQDSRLSVFIEKPFFGEGSAYRFLMDSLPFQLEKETIIVTFPSNYQLPGDIQSKDLLLSEGVEIVSVTIVNSNSLELNAIFTNTQSFDIKILQSAGITNPLEWNKSSVFALQFLTNDFIVLSAAIPLRSPNNTIVVSPSSQPSKGDVWLDQEIDLILSSSVSQEIRYSLNQGKEKTFQEALKLFEGIHELSYYGVRKSGAKESIKKDTFYIDLSPPQVKVLSPQNNHLSNKPVVELLFEIKDLSPTRVILNQTGEYLVPEEGRVSIKYELKPGRNVIDYRVIDSAKHLYQSSLTLFLDITPPYLVIHSPQRDEVICSSKVDITGKAELDSEVWIGDIPVKLDSYGNFSLQWTPREGVNQLLVRALDKAGNESRRDLQFMVFPGLAIEAWIGQNQAKINGKEKEISPAPFIDRTSNEVYFPLRFIAEALSYELQWVAQGSYVSMKKNSWEIRLRALDPLVQIRNSEQIEDVRMQFVPTVYQGSTMIPAEFIKRILGGDVIFDTAAKKTIIHFCEKTPSSGIKNEV
jgi:hypothetical protein